MGDEAVLDEQIAYYRAIADEYEDHAIDAPGQAELLAAFDSFEVGGDVLELACGPGQWTRKLITKADLITAVDASPEMIARARQRVAGSPVRFMQANLFEWQPDRHYDSVFFGFWLSHVPNDRFEAFWDLIARCLNPGGQVFFVDDNHRTEQELIEGAESSIVERRLNDGSRHRAVKVPHTAATLEPQLRTLGWDITVAEAGPFYWGSGRRASASVTS